MLCVSLCSCAASLERGVDLTRKAQGVLGIAVEEAAGGLEEVGRHRLRECAADPDVRTAAQRDRCLGAFAHTDEVVEAFEAYRQAHDAMARALDAVDSVLPIVADMVGEEGPE